MASQKQADQPDDFKFRSPWCALTEAYLARAGMNLATFAEMMGYSGGQATHLIKGRVRPAIEDADRFCDVLGLEGAERESYVSQVYLAHSPQRVRVMVEQLNAEVTRLRRELERTRKKRG